MGFGVLMGTAWAVVYVAAAMAMSELVTDQGRTAYFAYLTGIQQAGNGLGPVLGAVLLATPLGFRGTFFLAGTVCAAAAALPPRA